MYTQQRPDILAPTMYVTINDEANVAPGYLMITPNSPGATNFQTAPYIYNMAGVSAPRDEIGGERKTLN